MKTMSGTEVPRGLKPASHWIATFFGCGCAPVAPGTAGSLAATFIAFFLQPWHLAVLAAAITPAGI
jgi:hypothetical protein